MKKYLTTALLTGFVLVSIPAITSAHTATTGCIILNTNVALGAKDVGSVHTVGHVQDFLRAQGLLESASTGFFGNKTLKAVKAFQAKEKLDTVGSIGPRTRAAIQKVSCVTQATAMPVQPTQPTAATSTTQTTGSIGMTASAAAALMTPKNNLPYKTEVFSKWTGTWGNVSSTSTGSGSLYLKPSQAVRGAQAVLPDSLDWTDYKYSTSVVVSNGDVSLVGRYVDDENFLSCTFSGSWVGIQERVNGVTKVVASTNVAEVSDNQFFMYSTWLAMRVKGKTISCTRLGDTPDVTYTLPESSPLIKGGVGIATWGLGSGTLELKEVRVEAI